jgi:hypothetical protein
MAVNKAKEQVKLELEKIRNEAYNVIKNGYNLSSFKLFYNSLIFVFEGKAR